MKLETLLCFPKRFGRFALLLLFASGLLILLPIALLMTTGWRLDPAARWASSMMDNTNNPAIEAPYLLLHWKWNNGLHLTGHQIHTHLEDGSSLSLGSLHVFWPRQRFRDRCLLPARIELEGLSIILREDSDGQRLWLPTAQEETHTHHPQSLHWPLEVLPAWLWSADSQPIDIQLTQSQFAWNLPSIGAQNQISIPEFHLRTRQDAFAFNAELRATLDATLNMVEASIQLDWDSTSQIVSIETKHDPLTLEFLSALLPPQLLPKDFRIHGSFATSAKAQFQLGHNPHPLQLLVRWQSDDWLLDSPQWLPESIPLEAIDWSLNIDASKGWISTSALNIALPWTQIEVAPIRAGLAEAFSIHLQIKGDFSDIFEWLESGPDALKNLIPMKHPDIRLLAIGQHHISAEAAFKPLGSEQLPQLNNLRIQAETEIRIAEDKIPLKMVAQFDAQTSSWSSNLQTGPMHPFLWRDLSVNASLPVALDNLNFALSLDLDATGTIDAGLDGISVSANIPSGQIGGLIDTALPLPIRDFELFLNARPSVQELIDFNFSGNLCGADFKVNNARGKLADDNIDFQAQLLVSQLDFVELFPYLPEELANNEMLINLNPAGRVSNVQIDAILGGNLDLLEADPLSLLQHLQLNVAMDKLSFQLTPELSANLDTIFVSGNLAEISIDIPLIQIGELMIPQTTLRIENPLQSIPQLTMSTAALLDLARLHTMLDYFPGIIEPDLLATIAELQGDFHATAVISLPVVTPPDPDDWRVKLNADIAELNLPQQWLAYQAGPASLQSSVEWNGASAVINGSLNFAAIHLDPWIEGPMNFDFAINSDHDHALNGWFQMDLTQAHIDVALLNKSKTVGETADFQTHFTTSPINNPEEIFIQSRIDYNLWESGLVTVQSQLDPTGTRGLFGVQSAKISDLDILGNQFELDAVFLDNHTQILLNSTEINIPQALESLSSVVYDFLLALDHSDSADAPVAELDPREHVPSDESSLPGPLQNIYASFHIEKLILSPTNTLSDTSGEIVINDFSLHQANIRGFSGNIEILKLAVSQQPHNTYNIDLSLPDAAGLANILVSPLHLLSLPDTPTGNNLDVLRRVPDSFVGGRLLLEGIWHGDLEIPRLEGKFSCIDLYMIKAPCLLRIVAATSGKGFSEKVAFQTFSIDHFAVDAETLALQTLKFEGPFNMNIEHGSYRFSDQFIHVKGDHFLTNFEIEGPILGPPKVYLDNRASRWIGTDESDWSGM